jgi:hypothetical protein
LSLSNVHEILKWKYGYLLGSKSEGELYSHFSSAEDGEIDSSLDSQLFRSQTHSYSMCGWWWREREVMINWRSGKEKSSEYQKGRSLKSEEESEREIIITINSLAWSVSKREGAIGGRGRWFLYSKISSSSKEPFDGWTFREKEEGRKKEVRCR